MDKGATTVLFHEWTTLMFNTTLVDQPLKHSDYLFFLSKSSHFNLIKFQLLMYREGRKSQQAGIPTFSIFKTIVKYIFELFN